MGMKVLNAQWDTMSYCELLLLETSEYIIKGRRTLFSEG